MLYSVFWVIPRRLNFMRQRFGTVRSFRILCPDVSGHCSIFMGGVSRKMEQTGCSEKSARKIRRNRLCSETSGHKIRMEQTVPKRRHIQLRRRGFAQKKEYNNDNQIKHKIQCWMLSCSMQTCRMMSTKYVRLDHPSRLGILLLVRQLSDVHTALRKHCRNLNSWLYKIISCLFTLPLLWYCSLKIIFLYGSLLLGVYKNMTYCKRFTHKRLNIDS